jgi:hypothetical protein
MLRAAGLLTLSFHWLYVSPPRLTFLPVSVQVSRPTPFPDLLLQHRIGDPWRNRQEVAPRIPPKKWQVQSSTVANMATIGHL